MATIPVHKLNINGYEISDNVISDTTEGWNSVSNLMSEQGVIYVYTDHIKGEDGENIPGFKVGDGKAYIADLPFSDDPFVNHINNSDIHVTLAEKNFWNNKVRAYYADTENITFTTN